MQQTPAPATDPVAEVFDAVTQARHCSPGGGPAARVAVRSRTGQLLAVFLLDNAQQVQAFGARIRRLGYHMTGGEGAGVQRYDCSIERRAANETIHAPRRRKAD